MVVQYRFDLVLLFKQGHASYAQAEAVLLSIVSAAVNEIRRKKHVADRFFFPSFFLCRPTPYTIVRKSFPERPEFTFAVTTEEEVRVPQTALIHGSCACSQGLS